MPCPFGRSVKKKDFWLNRTRNLNQKVFGVKSFEHAFDRLDDQCDEHLNLVASFDGRYIKPELSWQQDLNPRLAEFMRTAALSGNRIRLALDAHATLAFAVGTVLDTKSGRVVELQQRTRNGVVIWAQDGHAV